MLKKIYLLWESFETDEILTIGTLEKDFKTGKYYFNFDKEVIKADDLGCFLPFNYTTETLSFNSLPIFFYQRIIKGEFNTKKFGLNDKTDEFDKLIRYNSINNSDNFIILNEEQYKEFKGNHPKKL